MTSHHGTPSLNKRKTDVQDILSSFSVNTLPSEFKPELFRSISETQDQSGLTISGDLEGTLMQWGTHDEEGYRFLCRIQPERTRSILFHQKVARRLEAELESYVEIDRSTSATEIRDQVREISNHLGNIVGESTQRQKQEGRAFRAGLFVDTLRTVCDNSLDISGSGRKTRRSSGSQNASLFHMLIAEPELGQDDFMLELLQWLADEFLEVLTDQAESLEYIGGRLGTLNAPIPYQQKFREILDKATGGTGGQQSSSAGPPPSNPAPPSGAAGKKRRAGNGSGRKGGKRRMGA